MPKQTRSPLALALTYLRTSAGWSMAQLARALGHADESLVSAYERGTKALTREQLESLIAPLDHSRDSVDMFLFAHGLIHPKPKEQAPSPVALTPEDHKEMNRAAMAAGWTGGWVASNVTWDELSRQKKLEKTEAARQEAEALFQQLLALTHKQRRYTVEAFPGVRHWALAVRVCEASVRSAAHKVQEALEWAELAVFIADRVPGEECWRSRLQGYCWAHVANARRVGNDLAGADEAFAWAWKFWRAGTNSEPTLFAEWRLYDLEASLRRDQRQFSESLRLLDQARAACGAEPLAIGRILLKREHVFEQLGDIQNAFAALVEAAPFVEISGSARQLFLFRFKSANHLCHLENYEESAKLIPQVRELAIQQANELDLIRVAWLTAKVAAGKGRTKEAIASLEQVGQYFTTQKLPYDAALSSLDLSVLWLKAERMAEVRELTLAMGWIFKANGIDREALAALKLFCEAAFRESATADLARQVIAEIEQARRSAPPSD